MQDIYRLAARNASHLKVVDIQGDAATDRLTFGTCLMIWTGLIASTWGSIAMVVALF